MADKKAEAVVKTQEVKTEAVYTAEELAAGAATAFSKKYTEDIVTAALRTAGVKSATITDAEAVIRKFLA